MIEHTFVIIKPDAVARGLAGQIMRQYEQAGFTPLDIKNRARVPPSYWREHYAEHVGKAFFDELIQFMASGPIIAFCLEGENAIECVRALNGATDPAQADTSTIRSRFRDATSIPPANIVHGSANAQDARRELELFYRLM